MQKKLTSNSLLELTRNHFNSVTDTRDDNRSIDLVDGLMSAFAMLFLKQPSLLAFQNQIDNCGQNLHKVFGIQQIPSDTNMRKMVDPVSPQEVRGIFKKIFYRLQRSKQLGRFVFMDGHYLVSCDGTGYFSSNKVHCDNCMQKKGKNGEVSYYHQFFGATIVHPDLKEVIPLAPEAIQKQDGSNKNDCERNASKRFLRDFRKEHPKLKGIIVEDSLASNAPHLKEITSKKLQYIIGAKPDDHKYLFSQVEERKRQGLVKEQTFEEGEFNHIFSYCNDLPLNKSNSQVRVNFLEYWEVNNNTQKTTHFTWVTSFKLGKNNIYEIMRGGRARWKIENETFNTLKNQGYHFEHNYGHGNQNLSFNMAMLMMLVFLIDQVLQLSCKEYNVALQKAGSKKGLWENIRKLFDSFHFENSQQVYQALCYGFEKPNLIILNSS